MTLFSNCNFKIHVRKQKRYHLQRVGFKNPYFLYWMKHIAPKCPSVPFRDSCDDNSITKQDEPAEINRTPWHTHLPLVTGE